ncbi:hypothetical protein HUK81_02635 [Komagataeibacter swingsii]|uniref:NADH:quinone oxidoreductase/Mrp antiporter membrane subunit domain-containing protein n=2 Tax=Komagataeibacter swingsii TaxID=215220 RepID=A0A850NW00_9PROT|nr:hypothetical protein [Komagataeibacter swingsii]
MVPALRCGWLAIGVMAVLSCLGVVLPGGGVAWAGFPGDARDVALLAPLGIVGFAASGGRDLAACAGAALAVTGGPVLSCIGAGWVLVARAHAPRGDIPRMATRQVPDLIALLLMAAALVFPAHVGWLLPGLCWLGTRGLLGLSFSPRVSPRGGCSFQMADIAAMVAAMALWGHLPTGGVMADMRWGGVLIVAGCLFYMTASWRALCAGDGRRVMSGLLGGTGALVIVLAGLGLLARADDLPAMATCASRTFMLVVGTLLTWMFMARAMDAMERAAGALVLCRLGGLGVLMPRLSALFSIGLLAESGLPPLLGFSIIWMLLHLLAAMPRGGGLGADLPLLLALLALGVGWAVRTLALVRIVAVMLCGRPRTPRGAGASDPSGWEMAALVLAALPVLCASIWPGYWLGLVGGHDPGGVTWPLVENIALASPDGGAVLYPARLCLLVAVVGGVVVVLRRMACPMPARQVAGWQQGAPPVPPWMVFGDPLTQVGPGNPARMLLDMVVTPATRRRCLRDYVRLRRRLERSWLLLARYVGSRWPNGAMASAPVVMAMACMAALIFIAWHG